MISDNARAGMQQAPARSLFNALGFTPEEMTLILDILKDGKSKEEREQIVAESLGYMEANCDGCSSGLAEMYQAYIDGKKELRDINMEFHAGYVSGEEVPGRRSCPM